LEEDAEIVIGESALAGNDNIFLRLSSRGLECANVSNKSHKLSSPNKMDIGCLTPLVAGINYTWVYLMMTAAVIHQILRSSWVKMLFQICW
jgi:hypothetical protein